MRVVLLAFVVFLTAGFSLEVGFAQKPWPAEPREDLRFGLISYDNPEDKIRDYQAIFSELELDLQKLDIYVKPRFAIGTYSDVLDWISRGLIDMAVLSPNAFAETQAGGNKNGEAPDCIYVATEGVIPADDKSLVNDGLKESKLAGKCRFEYNSLCIVSKDSALSSFDDLRRASKRDEVQFVFGDPMSTSSSIFPMHVLHGLGIDFRKCMEYSFGHRDSLELLRERWVLSGDGKWRERVAFVFDMAIKDKQRIPLTDRGSEFKVIDDLQPENAMKSQRLPIEVWVARKDFDKAPDKSEQVNVPKKIEAFRKVLLNHDARFKLQKPQTAILAQLEAAALKPRERERVPGPIKDFVYLDERTLKEKYQLLHGWAYEVRRFLTEEENTPRENNGSKTHTADIPGIKFPIRFVDIISLIRHYNRIYAASHQAGGKDTRARLALVLSGGGAKCAYEAGAVMQMEKQLRADQPQDANSERPEIDVELVVGTSGGALNAVPIAAGITSQVNTNSLLERTWKNLNALDIIQPPTPVKIFFGLCYAFVFFAFARILVSLVRTLGQEDPATENWIRLGIALLLFVFSLLIALFFFKRPLSIRIFFGICLGVVSCILFRIFVWLARKLSQIMTDQRWVFLFALSLIIIPLVVAGLFLFPHVFLHPVVLLQSHYLFYTMLLISWGASWAVPPLIVCAVLVLRNIHPVSEKELPPGNIRNIASRFTSWFDPRRPVPWWRLLSSGISLIVVALFCASQNPGGLFNGSPLEDVATERYAELFEKCGNQRVQSRSSKAEISNVIFNCDRRWRDLVITGSSLTEGSRGSKYFYLPGRNRRHLDKAPRYGSRGIRIGYDCDFTRIVDIALGSGTIFPVFPYHVIDKSPAYKMDKMQLIDGGFAHNTPIEAAVLWGATHIVLIGASPETVQEGKTDAPVIDNFKTAFDYLYDQAQIADVNAQEEAAVFTLRPEATEQPAIGLLDFGAGFADAAFKRGSKDAAKHCFVRQPTSPSFWDIQVSATP